MLQPKNRRVASEAYADTAKTEAKTEAIADAKTYSDKVWGGFIQTGADLNDYTGERQRNVLYEIQGYGQGIANTPPVIYNATLEVIGTYADTRLVQRVTNMSPISETYQESYIRPAAKLSGTWTFGQWSKQLTEKDLPSFVPPEPLEPEGQKNLSMVSVIKAGHGWTAGPTTNATFNLDDLTDKAVGDRSISITTNGTGNSGYVQKTGMNLDLTGKGLVFWIKVSNIASVKSGAVTVGNADGFSPAWFGALPIRAGNKSPLTEGEWFPVYLSPGNFGANAGTPSLKGITALRVTLTDTAGMPAPTLRLGGVGAFSDKTLAFPRGVISLTFDDTLPSHINAAAPKMAEHGFSGTAYTIYDKVGAAGGISMSELRTLQEVYGWEIAAHCVASSAHTDWTSETAEFVAAEFAAQKEWQDTNGFPTETFAYPIGPFNSTLAREAAKHYDSARSTYSWTNSSSRPHKYRLSSYVINAAVSLAGAKTWVDRCRDRGGWPIFLFHNLVASGAAGNDWLISDFNALVDYIATTGVPVATVGDVIRSAH